jgi:hypothetical protein
MEIVDPLDDARHRHRWLEWLGLEAPPPEPDTWVPVARAFRVDDVRHQSSAMAARLVHRLHREGIEGRQRTYGFDTTRATALAASGGLVTRVAVLVHHRDRGRAIEIAKRLARDEQERLRVPPISDEELAGQALETAPASEV